MLKGTLWTLFLIWRESSQGKSKRIAIWYTVSDSFLHLCQVTIFVAQHEPTAPRPMEERDIFEAKTRLSSHQLKPGLSAVQLTKGLFSWL